MFAGVSENSTISASSQVKSVDPKSFLDSEVVDFSAVSCRAQHLADRSCVSAAYIMPGNWQARGYILVPK